MSLDLLNQALLEETNLDNVAVKAEDLPQEGGGIKWDDHFFEPQPGNTYHLKFLPNLGGTAPIVHRAIYKSLPDPERKGKTFQYISSGNAKTCKVLQLFFDLNEEKKAGNALSEKKIKDFLSKTNQGCVKVQILKSPVKEDIGKIRMMIFPTFGPTASIATAINNSINPTKDQIEAGIKKQDIFNVFGSKIMILTCKESIIEGGQKVRDYGQPLWTEDKRYPFVRMEDGSEHLMNAELKEKIIAKDPEAIKIFEEFCNQLGSEDLSTYTYFEYKSPEDPRNNKETEEYIKGIFEKIDIIVPLIKEKSIQEIKNFGKAVSAPTTGKTDSAKDLQESSLPEELSNSVMSEDSANSNISSDDSSITSILENAANE